MELGNAKVVGVVLIIIIALGYLIFIMELNRRRRSGSRAAQFRVGGKPRRSEAKGEESREERLKRGEVSLRSGPRWKRRFRK